jgi:putative inorganic carbon (HCO3(-)) transporter
MLLQYYALGYDVLNRRPPGFLGHYMSAAGVTTAVLQVAVARLASGPRERPRARDLWLVAATLAGVGLVGWAHALGVRVTAIRLLVAAVALGAGALALRERTSAAFAALPWAAALLSAWALLVSQTRSAWVGAACGLLALAALQLVRLPRRAWAAAAVAAALLLTSPTGIRSRLTLRDESSIDRYYMWQAGLDMVIERPVFGQGPGMVEVLYSRFRWPEAPNLHQPHLHNNLMQLAAERGLPGLVFFLWWTAVALLAALREAQRSAAQGRGAGWPAAAVLASLAAVLAAGLFEYNLGDSEVLMLVLLLTAVPFARNAGRPA